jgi:uncharacterized membrane protein
MEAKIRKVLMERPMSAKTLQRETNSSRYGIKTLMNSLNNMCMIGEIYMGEDNRYHVTGGKNG